MSDEIKRAIEDAQQAINDAIHLTEAASAAIGRGEGGREASLTKTNLEQAGFWIDAAARKSLA